MSMVQQLIAAVTNAERQIDEQIMKLQSYQSEIDQLTIHVQDTLGGSEQQYAQKMMQQLALTRKEVTETVGRLQAAKEKLLRVRMI